MTLLGDASAIGFQGQVDLLSQEVLTGVEEDEAFCGGIRLLIGTESPSSQC